MKAIAIAAVVFGCLPVGALPALAAPTAAESTAAAEAERRGLEMYVYDQAAWHATDRFQADIAKRPGGLDAIMRAGFKGYIVEPGASGGSETTFYGEANGAHFAIARYVTSASQSISGGFVEADGDRSLSLLAGRMIDAREKAMAEMQKPDHGLCSTTPPNSLVLPPGNDGIVRVYIMTSTTDANVHPAGGHYRFDFDGDGRLIAERRFMKTCFPINYGPSSKGRPEIVVLTHLLDPQPTEIHAFVSRNIPVPLGVVTVSNKHIWAVTNGTVQYVQDVEGTAPPG